MLEAGSAVRIKYIFLPIQGSPTKKVQAPKSCSGIMVKYVFPRDAGRDDFGGKIYS